VKSLHLPSSRLQLVSRQSIEQLQNFFEVLCTLGNLVI
jgi:hypothetical protein